MASQLWSSLQPERWPLGIDQLPTGAVLVGGAVRDGLLGRLPDTPDLDFIVPEKALASARRLAEEHGGACIVLDAGRDMARVALKGWTIDLARQDGATLNEDLNRRDFRLNAIGLKLDDAIPRLQDPTGGLKDLREGRIVAVQEKNLQDDPLRLLRGIRLMAELDMTMDSRTLEMIQRNRELLKDAAPERIQAEVLRLVAAPAADCAIRTAREIDLLHPWSTRDAMAFSQGSEAVSAGSALLTANERDQALPLARLTALLTDAGLKQLRCSRQQMHRCERLRHWWAQTLGQEPCVHPDQLSEQDRLKLHQDLENDLPAFILTLPGPEQQHWLRRWRNPEDPLFHPRPPIDGNSLQQDLKVTPGPILGALIRHLTLERAYGRLTNREQALSAARSWLSHHSVSTATNGSCD
ncbi:tRNA nucleotidyltransferase (CCA-adding enzyme) [Synechococcus sp. A18-25c]|uniref:CCA tRNA nucleotidyltransferase n=1 Tax=unclassified Synechococcus TaxID=2626047 RepID=UPI0018615976|nr:MULTISPECIES: CCA tRNA nucleotidyltransferase [unclassified Synechococcus]QNI49360.1 tRNA nucleotidyltransferase (CCA-adding enzyme) [Synechococcus sp. A15-60]QNJ20974.1 tRNA nucleotidyltransferase (CCA-adding enzyme) [Synechococcus sp. A18-25c]